MGSLLWERYWFFCFSFLKIELCFIAARENLRKRSEKLFVKRSGIIRNGFLIHLLGVGFVDFCFMVIRFKPLLLSATTGSGVFASLHMVNEWLQFVTVLCSAVLGVYGVVQLFFKWRKK